MSLAANIPPPAGVERRRRRRLNIIGTDAVSVDIGSAQSAGLLLDLSETGMALHALVPLKPGSRRLFVWKLPAVQQPLATQGVVVWSDTDGRAGVRIEGAANADQQALLRWLQERTPVEPDNVHNEGSAPGADHRLAPLVDDARALVRADGAAIAMLVDGEIVCRASSGMAPDVGVHLQPGVGLSGECVNTGYVVHCENTATDPRVNAELCALMNLRSVLIVPLLHKGHVVGLIECLWSQAHAFGLMEIEALSALAAGTTAWLYPAAAASTVTAPPATLAKPASRTAPKPAWAMARTRLILITCCLFAVLGLLAGRSIIRRSQAPRAQEPSFTRTRGLSPANLDEPPAPATSSISSRQSSALKLTQKIVPEYPPEALAAKRGGVVNLELAVGPDGSVEHVAVLNGDPLLVRSAIRAAAQWRYEPAVRNGQPVAANTRVAIDFKAPKP